VPAQLQLPRLWRYYPKALKLRYLDRLMRELDNKLPEKVSPEQAGEYLAVVTLREVIAQS